MFVQLWRILKPFHRTFGWFALLLVIYEGLQIAEGYLISTVVRLYGIHAVQSTWIILFVILVIYDECFMRLDNAVDWHIIARHIYPIYKYLKMSALSKFLEMDIPWHQRHNSGALVGKVAHGVEKVSDIIEAMSWEFVPTLIQAILSIIPLLVFSPYTAGIATIAFVGFMSLTIKANRKRMPLRQSRHDRYEQEWHRSIEIVQAAETNIMFGQQDRLRDEQEALHDDIIGLGMSEARIGIFIYNRWRIRILTVSRRLILAIWVWQLYRGSLGIPDLIFISILTEKLFSSFWRFARLFDRASEASEGAHRLAHLMGERTCRREGTVPALPDLPLGIKMDHVSFSYTGTYTEETGALHDFTLHIDPGEIIALVGLSGAGKTTIRRIITGEVESYDGSVTVGGVEVTDWPSRDLEAMFSYVPQGDDVFIYAMSVGDNIAFSRPDATDEEIRESARLAGIHDFIVNELPDGYQTVVGERGKRLSGGQKQRLALARAILKNAPILVLDEATSAVDAITEHDIQANMKQHILAGKTAIIVAHRLSTVWDIADRIVVMDHGRNIEEGTHAQLMRQGGQYARLVELQTAEVV